MSYPPTDYIGFTIKTKDRKVFKHRGKGMIFETRADAESWVTWSCDEFDKNNIMGALMTADERIALEGCEVISVQGDL